MIGAIGRFARLFARLPPDLEAVRGMNVRDAERELRKTRTRREAKALISRHKHELGLHDGR